MHLKLAPKLFLINAGIILALTISFVGLSYFFSKSMYSNALNGIDLEVLEDFSETLGEHYEEHESWTAYVEDRGKWFKAADHSFFSVFFSLMEKVAGDNKPEQPYPSDPGPPPEGNPEWEFPFGTFAQRLSLLDADKKPLIDAEILNADASYQKIKSDGEVVGWLRVGKINMDMLPLAQYFFEQQLSIVYWSAAFGGLVASILSFILSRHITAPIKKLSLGAQQIARRNFKSTISIKTGDELQDLAESFNYISAELDQYHTRQKQWLSNISHELRAPLTLLVGEIYAICDNLTKCDDSTAEFIQDQVMHVKRISDDLYLLCQMDEIGLRLNCQVVELQEFVAYQLQRYENSFEKSGIVVSEEYMPVPVYVSVDSDRFGQVLSNIFENCLRYVRVPGQLWITVSSDADAVVIEVEDSGPGVPEAALSKLFDRLYRINEANRTVAGGAGLGLAICKEIVEAHGGSIGAASSSKGGLCVRLRLPVTKEEMG